MAAEWDNLIPDPRDMRAKNGSFEDELEDSSNKRPVLNKTSKESKKKYPSTSSEERLMSDEHDDCNVTDYVMEYTDIFEPTTQQKLEFVDIQEGDAISEPSDEEVVAHSRETKTYEHAEVSDSEESEDPSRLPPADMGADTYGIDVDLAINNGIADESDGCDEGLIMDNEGHDASLSNNIETSLGNFVEVGENRRREIKQVEEPKTEIIPLEASKTENKRAEKVKTESRQLEAQKVDGMIEEDSEGDEKEGNQVEDQKESEKEHLEKQTEILADDDYSDDTTEVDKLLEKDNTKVEKKVTHQKAKSKMVSSGTQVHEVEPLLNASQTPSPSETPSPEPRESPQNRRQFTPREYPGKAVKSIAIGTDDEYPTVMHKKSQQAEVRPGETQKRGKGSRTPLGRSIENGVKTSDKASTPPSTSTPTVNRSNRQAKSDPPTSRSSRQPPGTRGSQSSDAMFFKSRLSQTSKRRPKRHVWLVRDSEIHRLIAEKAAILRRYKEEGITGRQKSKGFPNYSEVDVLGLPSVGFSGRTKDDSHRSSLPYARHPSSSQGGYRGGTSSEDEDDRTNRLGTKGGKSGTFAVGLAARREQAESSKQHEPGDQDDGCELCAAEAREKEIHEKKLKELEAAAKAGPHHPRNLMLGIVYSAKFEAAISQFRSDQVEFLGSTNLMSPSAPNKGVRLQQAQEAIGRIKVPEGEEQPSSDVDLFISTERIKIVSSDNKQPLTDHHLKTISLIAEIGNIIVVMARLIDGQRQ